MTRMKQIQTHINWSLLFLISSLLHVSLCLFFHFHPLLQGTTGVLLSDTAAEWSEAGSGGSRYRSELKNILPNEALLTEQPLIILFPHGEWKGMADVSGDHRYVPKGSK